MFIILGLLLKAVILPLANAVLLASLWVAYILSSVSFSSVFRGQDLLAYIFSSLQS